MRLFQKYVYNFSFLYIYFFFGGERKSSLAVFSLSLDTLLLSARQKRMKRKLHTGESFGGSL